MRMLVLGAGLQGSACAYDLLQQSQVEQVTLAAPVENRLFGLLLRQPLEARRRDQPIGADAARFG